MGAVVHQVACKGDPVLRPSRQGWPPDYTCRSPQREAHPTPTPTSP